MNSNGIRFAINGTDPLGLRTCRNPCVGNGCGAASAPIDLVADTFYFLAPPATVDVKKCCNEHDVCYCICDVDKSKCDEAFRKCMVEQCEAVLKGKLHLANLAVCKAHANTYATAVAVAGAGPFSGGQSLGCADCDCIV